MTNNNNKTRLEQLLEDEQHLLACAHFYELCLDDEWFGLQQAHLSSLIEKIRARQAHLSDCRDLAPDKLLVLASSLAAKRSELSVEHSRLASERAVAHPRVSKPAGVDNSGLSMTQRTGLASLMKIPGMTLDGAHRLLGIVRQH